MKYIIFIVFVLNFDFAIGQADSIEYNIWKQIYDFHLNEGKYFFRYFNKGTLIESDSLIFDSETYFNNFQENTRKANYIDSVRFAVISRTLKIYKEPILYTSDIDFIRIIWLKYEEPVIIKVQNIEGKYLISFKKGTGKYELKGKLIEDTTFCVPFKTAKKLNTQISNINFFDKLNNTICLTPEFIWPDFFFVEAKRGDQYNIFKIAECNLEVGDEKPIFDLFKYLLKMTKDKTNIKYWRFYN
jgi:hypothetical protein